MTQHTSRNTGMQSRNSQQRQHGDQGSGTQHQQQSSRTPGQPGGGDPDVQEQMPDRNLDDDRGDPRRRIDVEREQQRR
jgi:hypothetical protein